ncbi:T cell receptor alpha chain MC.7.G5-like isoform X1 [Lagenorhynchus albirostris]|uniref:T cell receptor alpha chain MC.7.G5-like isoform X1 n=1 Tax=Lagenorhynchus albirostris TaxID=27610 RepID=UPI0028E4BCB8|nr:T cell receptor alpha chain MC.7.G5-like isoform X1 [Lagenorhynchus albirostris]
MTLVFTLMLEVLLFLRGAGAQSVTQPDGHITVSEGARLELRCNYSTSFSSYLFWYIQYPNQGLQLLLKYTSGNSLVSGIKGFEAEFRSSEKSFHLRKTSAHWKDSAKYFCALSDTTSGSSSYKLTFGKGTLLIVNPNIQNPDPAVYLLRSPKSSNTSVCLYTDFESQANVSQVTRPVVFSSDSTVLDMGALGSKSNGVVAWSSRTDLGCGDTFNQTFYSSSGIPCDAKIAEKSFETDMNLNFQNLSVIGFRVLLLKVVGYNLLMTLRLWSS